MINWGVNGDHRGLPWAKVGAVATGIIYAGLLTTRLGKRIEREHTWFTVMGGVFLTLGWVATEDKKAAERAFAFFVASRDLRRL